MDCNECSVGKQYMCYTACPLINAELCRIDDEIKEDGMRQKQPWQEQLDAEHRRNIFKWVIILTCLVSVCYLIGHVCGKPLPENLDSLVTSPGALARLGVAP